jgi:uncharacterized protein
MQINVSQLLKESIGAKRNYQVAEIVDSAGSTGIIEGGVRLLRTDRGILARCMLNTEVEVTCSRCLSLFRCPVALNIEEEYFPTTDVVSGVRLSLPEEPGSFTIDENHILDLSEAIRQYTLLVIPMKPLCREDCAGLCPHCGHNLNLGSCHCLSEATDPRWFQLTKLVNERKGTE